MDHTQLKENIQNFSLDDCPRGNQGYNRVLLQLFGFTGDGKSSLINSCKYALEDDGEYKQYADSTCSDGGVTMIRKAYHLTNNISIVDNRGYITLDCIRRAEIYAQMGSFMPLNERVHWEDNFTDMMKKVEKSEMDPNHTDFIVPVLVYSARNVLAGCDKEEMKIFLEKCVRFTEVAPIIVLTHKVGRDYFKIEKQFKCIGAETVIALENYTTESHIKTLGKTTDVLMFINSALRSVKFCMEQKKDPKRERLERKIFLLEYIHNAELRKVEEKLKWDHKRQQEKEKQEKERQEKERQEKERQEKERQEKERQEKERQEKERQEKERQEKERQEKERQGRCVML